MPFDPRPVSAGGNKGIDELFTREPSGGKYRVVGVDTFDGTDWVEGDYDTLEEAKKVADEKGGTMLKTHVYDASGKHVYGAGSF
jgi:hypothetical protein